jgi:hypothetical protein
MRQLPSRMEAHDKKEIKMDDVLFTLAAGRIWQMYALGILAGRTF